jgi:hypothetical protein
MGRDDGLRAWFQIGGADSPLPGEKVKGRFCIYI